jgi:hypothetical protein
LLPGRGNECAENAKTNVAAGFVRQDGTRRPTPADQDEEQSMAITREQIEKVRERLTRAPAPPAASVTATKQEAVRSLVGEIRALQRRGYTLEQVAEMLREDAILLTTQTLKNYLARAKAPQKGRAGKRTKAGGGAKAPAPAAATPRVSAPETGDGKTSEAMAVTRPAPSAEGRPAVAGSEGRRLEGASPEAPDGTKLRSGKDAFLIKDKVEY